MVSGCWIEFLLDVNVDLLCTIMIILILLVSTYFFINLFKYSILQCHLPFQTKEYGGQWWPWIRLSSGQLWPVPPVEEPQRPWKQGMTWTWHFSGIALLLSTSCAIPPKMLMKGIFWYIHSCERVCACLFIWINLCIWMYMYYWSEKESFKWIQNIRLLFYNLLCIDSYLINWCSNN